MQVLEHVGWVVEFDAEATRRAYAAARPIGPEACGCAHCRNFILARQRAYPPELAAFASAVGIEPLTETETYDTGLPAAGESGSRVAGGFFHFVGRVLHDPATADESFWMFAGRDLLPGSFGTLPVVQVEFQFAVPWLLAEAPDSPQAASASRARWVETCASAFGLGRFLPDATIRKLASVERRLRAFAGGERARHKGSTGAR